MTGIRDLPTTNKPLEEMRNFGSFLCGAAAHRVNAGIIIPL